MPRDLRSAAARLALPLAPVFVLAVLLGPGCGGTDPDPGPDCSSVADTTQPATVSYQNDVVPLFYTEKYNCLEIGCHGGGLASSNYSLATHAETLERGDQANLIGVCAVKPGDPDASYLVWKLDGRPGIQMERMPSGCTTTPDPDDCVSAEDLAIVRQWILEGARDN
jgi:hypothetical protein